jgi:hypothetical protein
MVKNGGGHRSMFLLAGETVTELRAMNVLTEAPVEALAALESPFKMDLRKERGKGL